MTVELAVSEADEREFAEFLQAQIREYNNRRSPHHRAARQPGAVKPLHVMLKDEAGRVVGGLSAHTYWDWLEIDDLFVPEDLRGQGLGSSLLETAETMAISFYVKRGYSVAGRLEGYPPGTTYYWRRKEL